MLRRLSIAALAVVLSTAVMAQETTDKIELRTNFTKGEKLSMKLKHKMLVTIDEIPEEFKAFVGEEPVNLNIEGTAHLEVKEVSDEGQATLEGLFQTMTVKGSMMSNEIDYAYDRAKDGDKPEEKDPTEEQDPGMPGMPNFEDGFRTLATEPFTLKIDKHGKMSIDGSDNQARQAGAMLFSMSALVGVLPKEKVGPGDSWKADDSLNLPGLPIKMKVRSTNKFEKTEKKNDAECAVIKSELSVGTEGGEEEEAPQEIPIPMKAKFTGKGSGTLHFDAKNGRAVSNDVKLDVKIDLTMGNPQGGDDIAIKGKLKMEQAQELKSRE